MKLAKVPVGHIVHFNGHEHTRCLVIKQGAFSTKVFEGTEVTMYDCERDVVYSSNQTHTPEMRKWLEENKT